MIHAVLMAIAVVAFIAEGVDLSWGRVRFGWFGLASWAAAEIIKH